MKDISVARQIAVVISASFSFVGTSTMLSLAKTCGFIPKKQNHALTEENLRFLNLANESLAFTDDDLLEVPPIPLSTEDLHALEFTDDDLIDIEDIEADSYQNWSIACAPPSEQMSEWVFESDDGRSSKEYWEETEEQEPSGLLSRGAEQLSEIWSIVKGFAKAIPG
ncbi:hypothetical protein BDV95DRAFT_163654 [Massariosphaeria phaeospora]|uniref:Uncharacterized protein n=1 Tax=Massariosphaeria phaeospora TaxID=100035 RepID=A0A7C8I4I1_9PLEO|nr:hypothetical protein BDV95DRAFT_163654 [Massariosphaeria phaeospora]